MASRFHNAQPGPRVLTKGTTAEQGQDLKMEPALIIVEAVVFGQFLNFLI